jgi:hypothetical protein
MMNDNSGIAGFVAQTVAQTAATTMVNSVVSSGYRAAVKTALSPAQLALDVSISLATAATTWLIMTSLKLAFVGTFYLVKCTASGISYLLFQPPMPKYPLIEDRKFNPNWDDCDSEVRALTSTRRLDTPTT